MVCREKLVAAIGNEEAQAVLPKLAASPTTYLCFDSKSSKQKRTASAAPFNEAGATERPESKPSTLAVPLSAKAGSIR